MIVASLENISISKQALGLHGTLGCHKELDTTERNFHFQQNIGNLIKYLILRVSVCHKELLYLFIYFCLELLSVSCWDVIYCDGKGLGRTEWEAIEEEFTSQYVKAKMPVR